MPEPIVILLAFIAGLVFRKLGLPALLGYLLAGFAAQGFGLGDPDTIAPVADLGITLLLFTIGLKLNLSELMAPQVWAVAGLQMLVVIPLTALAIILGAYVIPGLKLEGAGAAWMLAFALSFSSTVFAVKIFDERGESASLHAAIAIGILIVQDLIAVAFLVLVADKPPSLFALALVALPLLRPVLLYVMRLAGHGELLSLFGICIALVAAELFEFVHLKGGLGALVFGVLLGNSPKSNELYKNLIGFKDLFLIGFFVYIGYNGLPPREMYLVVCLLGLLIFLRPVIYFFLLVSFNLRARTALLAGLSLFNYSEFGLIVASLASASGLLSPQWVTTLALAMSLSFFIAIPFNARGHLIYARFFDWLVKFERKERLPEEVPVELGETKVLVLGMGRVGLGAYHYLQELYADSVAGVEENLEKANLHQANGLNCVHADASDRDFWEQAHLSRRSLILVSLTNHNENIEVVNLLRQLNYQGQVAVVSRFPDEKNELLELGCITFDLYAEAGHGFAEHVMTQIEAEDVAPLEIPERNENYLC
ncbi:MAG: cation:proton antiporter [Exilibacterium sp.]